MGGEVRMDAALLPACSSGCRSIETGFRQGVLMLNDADLCTLINGSCVGSLQAGTNEQYLVWEWHPLSRSMVLPRFLKTMYNSRCILG
jgi:hypothetical protein